MGTNFHKIKYGLNIESRIGPPANLQIGDVYFDSSLGQLQFSGDGVTTQSAGSLVVQSNGPTVSAVTTTMNFVSNLNVTVPSTNHVQIDVGNSGFVITGGNLTVPANSTINTASAGTLSIGTTMGANSLTLGGSSSTVSIPGTLNVSNNVTVGSGFGFENTLTNSSLRIGSSTNTATLYIGDGSNVEVINVGTGVGAKTINIGGPNDTVALNGTVVGVITTDAYVSNHLFRLNVGNTAGSGNGSGIAVDENGILDGYIIVNNSRASWDFIVPASVGTIRLTPDAYIAELKSTAMSANRTYTLPDATGTLVLTSETISTSAPLSGGGDLSANRTISMTQATTSVDGYLNHTDWNTFNNKQSTLTLGNIIPAYAPLSISGGTGAVVGSGVTVTLPQSTTSVDGYLTHTDWNTFNGKLNTSFSNVTGTLLPANGGTGQISTAAFPTDGYVHSIAIKTISASTSLASGVTYFVNTAAPRTLTLPAPVLNGYVFIKDSTGTAATNPITLTPSGGLIDGASSQTLGKNWGTWAVASDGTNWFFIINSSVALGGSL